jgi:hypothetical protein
MHPTTQTPAFRPDSASPEDSSPLVEVTPELIAYHIQLGRQLRSEAFARLTARLARRLGAALTRLVERHDQAPGVRPAVR